MTIKFSRSRKMVGRAGLAGLVAIGLSGCTMYDGGLYSAGYGDGYYDDGYGYDSYGSGYDDYYDDDYRAGYPNMGYGGGWYDNYYYPGYGIYIYDRGGQYYRMNDRYRSYWGGHRYNWRHRGDRDRDGRRGRDRDGERGLFQLPAPTQGAAPAMRERPERIRADRAPIAGTQNRGNGAIRSGERRGWGATPTPQANGQVDQVERRRVYRQQAPVVQSETGVATPEARTQRRNQYRQQIMQRRQQQQGSTAATSRPQRVERAAPAARTERTVRTRAERRQNSGREVERNPEQ